MKKHDSTTKPKSGNLTIKFQNGSELSLDIKYYLYSGRGTIIIAQSDNDNHFAFCTPDGLGLPGSGHYNVAYPNAAPGEYRLKWFLQHNGILKEVKSATMGFSSKDFRHEIDGNIAGVFDDNTSFTAKFTYTK